METLRRMRTAAGVLNEIRRDDPETDVTLHFIRCIIRDHKIPVIHVGKKDLVDVDDVIQHINASFTTEAREEVIPPGIGTIRPVTA